MRRSNAEEASCGREGKVPATLASRPSARAKQLLVCCRTCVLVLVAYVLVFRLGSMLTVRFINYQKR